MEKGLERDIALQKIATVQALLTKGRGWDLIEEEIRLNCHTGIHYRIIRKV